MGSSRAAHGSFYQPGIESKWPGFASGALVKVGMLRIKKIVPLGFDESAWHAQNNRGKSRHPLIAQSLAGPRSRVSAPRGRKKSSRDFFDKAKVERDGSEKVRA